MTLTTSEANQMKKHHPNPDMSNPAWASLPDAEQTPRQRLIAHIAISVLQSRTGAYGAAEKLVKLMDEALGSRTAAGIRRD